MTASQPVLREHGNAYNIFILVLTLFSLTVMGLLVLPVPQAVRDLLLVYDNVFCLIFLVDFLYNITGSHPKRAYFVGSRGWLDLLGSLPSLGVFQLTALFRLARLSRLARIGRLLRAKNRTALVEDVLRNRGQYATFITILSAGIVLCVAGILVLAFESTSTDANIKTGGDALWWGAVTITTVGYGDRFPVTLLGRLTGLSVMIAGVGIIGALASILASLLVSSGDGSTDSHDDRAPETVSSGAPAVSVLSDPARTDAILAKLAELQAEMASLRAEIADGRARQNGPRARPNGPIAPGVVDG